MDEATRDREVPRRHDREPDMFVTNRTLLSVSLAAALALGACGEDPAKVDNLFLKVTSEAPTGGGKLDSLRILFSKNGKHFPADATEAAFNPPLGGEDPTAGPVHISVKYNGQTFDSPTGVTLLVTGRVAGKVVTASETVVDLGKDVILPVRLTRVASECDLDSDGFLDCDVTGCCATGRVLDDCEPSVAGANPWGVENTCEDADDIDNDCSGSDVTPPNDDGDPVVDCKETACGADAGRADVYPAVGAAAGAPELCDSRDNDCDGSTDEGLVLETPGDDLALGAGCGVGKCAGGVVQCDGAGGVECSTAELANATEGCDGADEDVDDDCDGTTDEGCGPDLVDVDGDGVPNTTDCDDFDGGRYPGNLAVEGCCDPAAANNAALRAACDLDCDDNNIFFCEEGDEDGDGFTVAEGDCDDDPSDDQATFPARLVYPGAGEKCGDDVDQDCQDGDLACAGITDGDNDDWPAGADCDDFDDKIAPDAPERCNAKDDDCDGLTDEDNPTGGGACGTDAGECSVGTSVCTRALPDGETCMNGGQAPCLVCPNDVEGTEETCNDKDDDCDGDTDDGFAYKGVAVGESCDGEGACGQGTVECLSDETAQPACSTNPNGSASQATDEVCDTLDNDCDGDTNEGLTDVDDSDCDRDGVCGDNLQLVQATCLPAGGWSCNYANVPGYQANAETLCDGKDNDCDGGTDEDVSIVDARGETRFVGQTCDGADADQCANGLTKCDPLDTSKALCDESTVVAEVCDNEDNDCDGQTDEGFVAGAGQDPTKVLSGAAFADDNGKYKGAACGTGECGAGTVQCHPTDSARLVCATPTAPTPDVCDDLDNDCDGTTDDDFLASATGPNKVTLQGALAAVDNGKSKDASCGVGECAGGTVECNVFGTGLVCSSNDEAQAETCDGLDDSCNGETDEGSPDLDGDGEANCSDDDDDGDGVLDVDDGCPVGQIGWTSSEANDYDGDGCRDDHAEDPDDDNDGVDDDDDACAKGEVDWTSGATTDHDGDGCRDDDPEDQDDDNDGADDDEDDCARGDLGWVSAKGTVGALGTDWDEDGCRDAGEDGDDDADGKADAPDLCDPDTSGSGDLGATGSQVGWARSVGAHTGANADYDDDGCRDADEDGDDDADGKGDASDLCDPDATGTGDTGAVASQKGWTRVVGAHTGANADYDDDGCRDSDEDGDDDADGKLDAADRCDPDAGSAPDTGAVASQKGWTRVVGAHTGANADYDDDGCRDSDEDGDDDNDGKADADDRCDPDAGSAPDTGAVASQAGWTRVVDAHTGANADYDDDGCRDSDEDGDDDNDGKLDAADRCDPDAGSAPDTGAAASAEGWTRSVGAHTGANADYDDDGCRDSDEDGDDDNDDKVDGDDRCDPDAGTAPDTGAVASQAGWTRVVGAHTGANADYDDDGCRDSDEDGDDDNDGKLDGDDRCDPDAGTAPDTGAVMSQVGWTRATGTIGGASSDWDDDGCRDQNEDGDDDNDAVVDGSDLCDPDSGDESATGSFTDHDVDGCRDSDEDGDDDGDGVDDGDDPCDPDSGLADSATGAFTDYDDDGCRDSDEDGDDDDDGVDDVDDGCDTSVDPTFTSAGGPDIDGDGCKDDDDGAVGTAEDADDDGDGWDDDADDCPIGPAVNWDGADLALDWDEDGCKDSDAGNEDTDDDDDGVTDASDRCDPDASGPAEDTGAVQSSKHWDGSSRAADFDADGCKDENPGGEDPDDDNDTVLDDGGAAPCTTGQTVGCDDNCRVVVNLDQTNSDDDVLGDACDDDDDNDGDLDGADNCPLVANGDQSDLDGDSTGDLCDTCTDVDGDGLGRSPFGTSTCPGGTAFDCNDTPGHSEDMDGDNVCDRGDRTTCSGGAAADCDDNCPVDANPSQADANSNGVGDACDPCEIGEEPFEVCGDCLDNDCTPGTTDSGTCVYRRVIGIQTDASGVPAGYSIALTFDHAFLVTNSLSTNANSRGDDVRVYHRHPTTGVMTEIDRVLDPESAWNFRYTTIWFKAQQAIPATGDEVNTDYYLYTGVTTGTPLQNENNVFVFADFFDRTNATAMGVPGPQGAAGTAWDEAVGSNEDLTIATNGLDVDFDGRSVRPAAFHAFAQTVTAGRLFWRTSWNWDRVTSGGSQDNTYATYWQLVDTSSTGTFPPSTTDGYADAGVGPVIMWARDVFGFVAAGEGDLGVPAATADTGGTPNLIVDEFSGAEVVDAIIDLDNDEFAVDGDGTGYVTGLPFNHDDLSKLDGIRYISHAQSDAGFPTSRFEYVVVRRLVDDGEIEPIAYLGVKEPIGPACTLSTTPLARWFLDDARDDALGASATVLSDLASSPADLTRVPDASPVQPLLVEAGTQHGLYWSTADDGGVARLTYTDSKFKTGATPLEGAMAMTLEVVAEIYGVDASETVLLGFQNTGNSQDRLSIMLAPSGETFSFRVYWENALAASWTLDVLAAGRSVYHVVIDTTQATSSNRIRLYRDGRDQGAATGGTAPTLNNTLSLDSGDMSLGNDTTADVSPWGFVYYAAIYRSALDVTTLRSNMAVLRADDDRR